MEIKVLMDNWLLIPIEKIVESKRNYKEKDSFMQDRLETSIKRIGQVENIQVRELDTGFYEVVNGNHRLEAFKTIGKKEIIVYNHGKINQAEAERRAIETNETKFRADMIKLAEMIKDIKIEIPGTELSLTMPFKEADFINMQNLLNFDWTTPVDKEKGSSKEKNDIQDTNDKPQSEHDINSNRTLIMKLPVDIAEGFEYQMRRIKMLLFPKEMPEHVADSAAIQAMVSALTLVSDDTFAR